MDTVTAHYLQDVEDVQLYRASFEWSLARVRKPGTDYALGVRVRSPIPTGFEYEATTAGRSGGRSFRWPEVLAGTVADGSVIWTAREISTASLESTVSSVIWSADSGITLTPGALVGQLATATLEGGEPGRTYEVRVEATMADGTERMLRFTVEITKQPGTALA